MRIATLILALALAPLAAAESIDPRALCTSERPATPAEPPLCADYELNSSLFEAGDPSALALLQRRFAAEVSAQERIRIAAGLLGRVPDDSAQWNELARRAAIAVKTPFDAFEYDDWDLAIKALQAVSDDARALSLLREGLKLDDRYVLAIVTGALAEQKDAPSLPLIEEALKRFPHHASWLAMKLAAFESEAADAIAFRYLSEEDREEYRQ